MTSPPSGCQRDFHPQAVEHARHTTGWHIAWLYAGLLFNFCLLESVSYHYGLVRDLPRLSLLLLGYGVFLAAAVFYVPARLSANGGPPLEDLLRACLGRKVAWILVKIVIPAWIFYWLWVNTWWALRLMEISIFHPCWTESNPWRWPLGDVLWMIAIVPAAKLPFPALARFSVVTTKVSLVLIFALALSTPATISESIKYGPAREWETAMPLEANLLLWAGPPLLFAGRFTRGIKVGRRALLSIAAAGIVLPVTFVGLAATLTVACGEGPMKLATYFEYAFRHPHEMGWGKVLALTLTLLAATRFSANLGVQILTDRPRLWIAAAVTAVAIGTVWLHWSGYSGDPLLWLFEARHYTAAPFVPLAGVLSAAFVRTRGRAFAFSPGEQWLSSLAWAAGCTVTLVPTWTRPYLDDFGTRPAWVMLGWLVSFVGTWVLTAGYSRLTRESS